MPDEGARGALSPESPITDALWNDWETPLRVPSAPVLHLDGFDGPIDLLLDLAERQRLDLGRISVIALVDQFVAASAQLAAHVALERRADWLVMATRLVLLRSRLMFPASPEAAKEAEREAHREVARLDTLQFVRAATGWLQARPVLGQDAFVRPARERDPRAASYFDLMEACLTVLRDGMEDRPGDEVESVYRPAAFEGVTIPEALAHIRKLLADQATTAGPLEAYLPPLDAQARKHPLVARSAVASTLVAALELCRSDELQLDQEVPFGSIIVSAAVGARSQVQSQSSSRPRMTDEGTVRG
jgi:segregation and condensation protein A